MVSTRDLLDVFLPVAAIGLLFFAWKAWADSQNGGNGNGNGNGDGTARLTINSINQFGQPESGNFTQLYAADGTPLESGFMPHTFIVNKGVQYNIDAQECFVPTCQHNYTFMRWQDGVTARNRPVNLTGDLTLTAVYNVT